MTDFSKEAWGDAWNHRAAKDERRKMNDLEQIQRAALHDDRAERCLIRALMIKPSLIEGVSDRLDPKHIYAESHRIIYRALLELRERGDLKDGASEGQAAEFRVAEYLQVHGLLEAAGGGQNILSIGVGDAIASQVEEYVRPVLKAGILREAAALGDEIAKTVHEVDQVDAWAERMTRRLTEITSAGRPRGAIVGPKESVKRALRHVEESAETRGRTGVPSGFIDLDDITGGWQNSDLIIIGARPSMGKSLLAGQMAYHACAPGLDEDGRERPALHKGLIFSIEMPAFQWTLREAIGRAQIEASKVHHGMLNDREWPMLIKAMGELGEARVWIDETPGIKLGQLIDQSRRAKEIHDIDYILVDYLQLVRPSQSLRSRQEEIGRTSGALKELAKELDVPVIALAQLNRELEKRQDKRPRNSDLREAGDIEQDADVIGFIHREEVYSGKQEDAGKAELLITKHRNGALGTVNLKFDGARLRFRSVDPF